MKMSSPECIKKTTKEVSGPKTVADDKPTKVRKTKAGFEPYQVKKSHPVSCHNDGKSFNDNSLQTQPIVNKNHGNSSNRKNSHTKVKSDFQKSKKKSHFEPTVKEVAQKEDWDIEIAMQDSEKTENVGQKIQKSAERVDSLIENGVKQKKSSITTEEIRRKTQGISILECPCSHSTSDSSVISCTENCSLAKSLANSKSVSNENGVNEIVCKLENSYPFPVSPTSQTSIVSCNLPTVQQLTDEKNVSDNGYENSVYNKQALYDNHPGHVPSSGENILILNDQQSKKKDALSSDEINAMFLSVKEINTPAINKLNNESNEVKLFESCSKSLKNENQKTTQSQEVRERNFVHPEKSHIKKDKTIASEVQKHIPNKKKQRNKSFNEKKSSGSDDILSCQNSLNDTPKIFDNKVKILSAKKKDSAEGQDVQVSRHVRFSDSDKAEPVENNLAEKEKLNIYIKDIKEKQFQLSKLLEKGFQSMESIKLMITTAEAIQHKYVDLIISYQDYAFKFDYESALWKSAFHNIISQFREFLDSENISTKVVQDIGKFYWHFLQSGIQFLDMLLMNLQEHHDFVLEDYLEDPALMLTCKKQVKLALRSCHLLLIFIGDLERYIAQLQNENNFEHAVLRYKQAQILVPKNGKSYNQLAVVAVVARRKLDAVYYYARSLQASNPILSAKDRLTAIFQEIKKKAWLFDQYHVQSSNVGSINAAETQTKFNNRISQPKKNSVDHLSQEVWTFYQGGRLFKVMLTDDNKMIDLTPNSTPAKVINIDVNNCQHDRVTLRKVNKGFMIHFLLLHSMLYTNIGLEKFTLVHQETLSDLTTLLQYPRASSIKQESLLKYIAINLFAIHNTLEKQESSNIVHGTALDLAIVFGMDMFSILSIHCTQLLKENQCCDQFMPAIRTWMKWLADHCDLVMSSSVSSMLDLWSRCCELFTCLAGLQNELLAGPQNELPDEKENENGINAYLLEDLFLAGFKPLKPALLYCKAAEGQEEFECSKLRLKSLGEILYKMDAQNNCCFVFDEKDNKYKPIQTSVKISSPIKKTIELEETNQEEIEDFEDDVIYEDDENDDVLALAQINELKLQKAALQKILQEQEEQRNAAMAVIESQRKMGRNIYENCPSTIIADTNCYIDHLDLVQILLQSKDFCVIVPLIVINELDGLKKGSSNTKERLQQNARLAVDVLEDWFSRKDSSLRAITSNGTEMTTIAFRAEEFSNDRGTNDDVILSCCLQYCKESITRSEGDSRIVLRNAVLLTDDRNLRVKAHSRSVPTIDIVTFMKMAKLV